MPLRLLCALALVAALSPSYTLYHAGARTQAIALVREPYLQQVTPTSAIVVWTSRESGAGEVRYQASSGSQKSVWATTTLFAAATTGLTYDYYQHEATLDGLAPSTTYAYEVRVGGSSATGGSGTVTTAPPIGTGAIRFLAFGDSGTGSTEQRTLATLMRTETFDLAVHTGDVVYGNSGGTGDGSHHTLNNWFFGIYRDWLRAKPIFPSLGNHDSRASTSHGAAYLATFVLPAHGASPAYPDHAERFYSFDYGPVHFVALDSERALQEPARRGEQLAWLEADLAATTQPWTVAYFHRSPYSGGLHHGSDLTVRQAFTPLFEKYGVQLVLSAHDHLYERTLPWRASAGSGTRGVTYVVTGGGGAPVYAAGTAEWTAFSSSAHHYVRAAADPCTLTLEAVGLDGGVFDAATLDICQPLDTSSPTVTIVEPADGAAVSGTATISVAASDDVKVAKVGLYVDGALVNTLFSAPWTFSWHTTMVADGEHTLEARAYDTAGNRASSGIRTARVSNSLPAPWQSADIGAVGLAGRAGASGGIFTVAGAGDDIWNAADAFRFVYQPLSGDGEIVARVGTVEHVHAWTKAGVMMRETLGAGSRHASMFVTPAKGLAFQRRTTTSGTSLHTAAAGTAPVWVKLVRAGSTFSGYRSADGTNWTLVDSSTIAMGSTILVGVAVTSHREGVLATASFDAVRVSPAGSPAPWAGQDIGAVGHAGSADEANGVFTVKGSGADVWSTADAFHFTYRELTGDGEIVARVATVENTDQWAKAGVMMRETLAPGSRHAFALVSPSKGLAFQRRVTTGGESTHTSGGTGTAPRWVRLVRSGATFSAYVSTNGTAWTLVGTDTIPMGSTLYVGLAVTSHNNSRLCAATFDAVTISGSGS